MRAAALLLLAVSCASPPPASAPTASAPAPAAESATASGPVPASPPATATTTPASPPMSSAASTATSAPAAAAPATGGSVLIGEIPASKKFNPKPAIEDHKDAMLDCYNKARASKPELAGKLKLLILVNAVGAVLKVDAEPGGSANDPKFVECIGDVLKTVPFPKPGGMATVVAPLVFRP